MIDSPQMVELTNYQLTTNPPSPILRRLDPANLTKDPFVIAQTTKSPSNPIRRCCLDLLSMVALGCSAMGGRYMLITKTL